MTRSNPLSIGQYLLNRLNSYGVNHIFGVPGDYVLRFDKLIEQDSHLKFINTTQEDGAGYAADAYARMKGLGVACITYGVGLGIANCLAQAYVESSPLVVISGNVGIVEFKKNRILHHLINRTTTDQTDTTQLEIFKHLTIDQGILDSPKTAAAIIDRVLNACFQYKKPVYLEIPRDMVDKLIENHHSSHSFPPLSSDPKALHEGLKEMQTILSHCKKPLLWVGHEILRFGLSSDLLQFAEKYHIPIVSFLLGKTAIDEFHPLFVGVYQGQMSTQEVLQTVEEADCIVAIGGIKNDLDTGIFTAKLDQEHHIEMERDQLIIDNHHFQNVILADFIRELKTIDLPKPFSPYHSTRSHRLPKKFVPSPQAKITTKRLFEGIQSHLNQATLVMSDVGDCLFASSDLVLPFNSYIACSYFASMGFATPGAIGAQLANPNKRVIEIVGDGAFQMTAMELSAAVRYKLDPIVIVLNNHGYGTERPLLEGAYNDILNWKYSEIPRILGGGKGIKVTTEEALDQALKEALSQRGTFYLIEIDLEPLDFSPALRRLGELLGKIVKS